MSTLHSRRFTAMGTVVEFRVAGSSGGHLDRRAIENAMDAAAAWFDRVRERLLPIRLDQRIATALCDSRGAAQVSPLLFSAIHFAIAVAEETDGAFDPTVGARMEALGFDRHHRSGEPARSTGGAASWRDVRLDDATGTVTLLRPLTIDLGAVAKGLAIDLAARELKPFANFAIDAGGDLYLAGVNDEGAPWSVGIRHPRGGDAPIDTVRASDLAVCTSGDYERRSGAEHHLIDPASGKSTIGVTSVTAVGESAMVADALGTAAFVLGPQRGIDLLERHGLEGMIVDDALAITTSSGWESLRT